MSQMNTHVKTRLEAEDELAKAMRLLDRSVELLADSPVKNDPKFWKDLYLFTGQHMILTDEGWDNGENKQSYVDQAEKEGLPIGDFILDEVNAPPRVMTERQRQAVEDYVNHMESKESV
jgi:hypothetical protein